ncbi:hypothetical protein BTUL_0142g00240 [Botrytis tulipae]|uniref:Uncharacterized protein n=1 Tax=Botrytis tulipae TaxID=87230 RepID=A0A4Z1ED40_9HELO|nr:hypothetical protein BTUL_0142g00240 [Botrytis tulipae]
MFAQLFFPVGFALDLAIFSSQNAFLLMSGMETQCIFDDLARRDLTPLPNCSPGYLLSWLKINIHAIYITIYQTGYITALLHLYNQGPHVLPDSHNPILTQFCGIPPIDKLLTLAGVMFANITDGSALVISLYAFQFAGQLVSEITIIMVESLREGNRGTVFALCVYFCVWNDDISLIKSGLTTSVNSFLPWGVAMQILGYGFIMPIYCCVHLVSSHTAAAGGKNRAREITVRKITALATLPVSICIGYIIPSILISLPFRSTVTKQWFGGLWQGFPVWISTCQLLLGILYPKFMFQPQNRVLHPPTSFSTLKNQNKDTRLLSPPQIQQTILLLQTYNFALTVSTFCHFLPLTLTTCNYFLPFLFPPHHHSLLTFPRIFIPPPFWSQRPMETMAMAIHHFLQYDQYIGSSAAFTWAMTLNTNSREQGTWREAVKLRIWSLGISILTGPGGAVVWLLRERDLRIVFGRDLEHGK